MSDDQPPKLNGCGIAVLVCLAIYGAIALGAVLAHWLS